ncbi:N-carbamoylputrescine amidase [Haematococcus lacustris]|uniref:N-carbamoylputrescine amidase n=1 Tax=Haematococcus lacustris TaxID=44745 RepID=A0A6A0A567_HAELA|nr:N-carbamoylputrescine amidase [Haematococcus lacustris]
MSCPLCLQFYFSPGDTGFRVFDTRVGRLGVAVCWDQWFPEAARAMVLQGAEHYGDGRG